MLMSPNRLNTYLISISLTNKNDACVSFRMAPTSLIVGAFFKKSMITIGNLNILIPIQK